MPKIIGQNKRIKDCGQNEFSKNMSKMGSLRVQREKCVTAGTS